MPSWCRRRPPHFRASCEEAAILRVSVALAAARPAADLPTADFVQCLERRLRSLLPC
jgi:hypothetical protein